MATSIIPTAFEIVNDTRIAAKQDPESVLPPEKKLKSDITRDVDSGIWMPPDDYDDGYLYDNSDDEFYDDGLHTMTREEAKRYGEQMIESEGFDVGSFPNIRGIGMIRRASVENNREEYESFSKLAVEQFNKKENANIQFEKVVKVNMQAAGPFNYYITFNAKDTVEGVINTYQTRVCQIIPLTNTFVDFVRLKPGSSN